MVYNDMEEMDNTVTVHKIIIKDIISNLRKAIKKEERTGLEFFCPDIRIAVKKLYQLLNEDIS